MFVKILILLTLVITLYAEDDKPTIEQLQTKVAEQTKEIILKNQAIAYFQYKLQMYQQRLFACEDAQIDIQAKQAANKPMSVKP